jgi:hypothetical protein
MLVYNHIFLQVNVFYLNLQLDWLLAIVNILIKSKGNYKTQ